MDLIKKLISIFLLFAVLGIILSCTDSLDKTITYDDLVRIEYSDCSACYECLDRFRCPEGAIKIDSSQVSHKAYIDVDLCVQCMECTNIFQCPENAFRTQPDLIAPASVKNLSGLSPQIGELYIQFIATGDDSTSGTTYKYDFFLTDSNDELLATNFEVPLPFVSGYWEYWDPIDSLPPGENVTIHIAAIDEAGNVSPETTTQVQIMDYPDLIAPAAISDLAAISVTEESITLQWSAVGDDGLVGTATSYFIKIHTANITVLNWATLPEYPNNLIPAETGQTEEFIIEGLLDGTNYFIAMKTIDDASNLSGLSNVANAATTEIIDVIPPAAISDLQIETTSISMDTFTLNWTAVGDDGMIGTSASYIVKIHTEIIDENNWNSISDYNQNLVPAPAGTSESLSITGLEPLTEYYAAIKAADEAENIAVISNNAFATTTSLPDTEPPDAISDLDAEATETTIDLTWTAPGDDGNIGVAASYEIRFSEFEINESNWQVAEILINPPLPLVAGSLQNYSATGLDINITYYFAIKTSDESNNESALSNVPNAMIITDIIPPAAITDLATEGTETTIELTWTATGDDGFVGSAHHYEIRMLDAEISETNWIDAEILPGPPWPLTAGSPQDYTVEALEHNQTYFFAIKAFDDNNNVSEVSNSPYSMLINDIIPPADITNLSVYAGYAVNLTTIKIQWTAPGDNGDEGTCDHYEIKYSFQPIDETNWNAATLFNDPPIPLTAGANQFCNVTGLNSATIYYFAVKAFDEAGNSNNISNSPAGKLVYQINTAACHNCNNQCILDCTVGAIQQGPGYKFINPDQCTACGDCTCPWNLIYRAVVAY